MFDLRPYQSEALAAVEQQWREGINRPVIVLPTGAGKTVCFSGLIAGRIGRLRMEGKRVLVLAHREELLEQAEAKIRAMVPGIWTALVKGGRGQKKHEFADVIVASVQTLARPNRRAAIDRIGLVIVDECHRYAAKSYRSVLDHYGCLDERQTPTVGFTATLTRMDGGLPDVWQSVAYQKKIHWMIREGFLVPPVARSVDIPGLNLATTRVTGGDLNAGDLATALENSHAFGAIADSWTSAAATPDGAYTHRPTIAFMPDVATTRQMTAAFRSRGVAAETVVGETPTVERRAAYERLASGATRVLVSCMTLTEGFDSPSVSCVLIGRPTMNPGLYIQMVGRGLRLAEGKTDCLVLDVAGASLNHSLAGVNDLEADCGSHCDCKCLSCGCSDRCKCGVRQCGCDCIERHEAPSKGCRCAGSEDCSCRCEGDPLGTGDVHCICNLNDDCGCRGEAPVLDGKEVSVDVLKTLKEVDILGEELAGSSYNWLQTSGVGARFLQTGSDQVLFLLPDPNSPGHFFQGRMDGFNAKASVTRLDDGSLPADEVVKALEVHADKSGYPYSNKRAAWHRAPASEAQKGLLRRMKVEFPDDLRKGAASDLVSVAKATRAIESRFGKYFS